jgi:hypothetical protein
VNAVDQSRLEDGEAVVAGSSITGSATALDIGGPLLDAFETAVQAAKLKGRFVYASRLMKLRSAVREAGVHDIEREIEERTEQQQQALATGEVLFKLELPIYTKCEANARGHWSKRNEGIGDTRPAITMSMRAHASVKGFKPPMPCIVRMTRFAPALLDRGDNLASALKKVRDGIADWIRVDDRHAHLVDYVCEQALSKTYAVRIEIIAGGKSK